MKLPSHEAIERLRMAIVPEVYRANLQQIRDDLTSRAALLLVNYDLNQESPHLTEEERESANGQLQQALVDIEWRLQQIREKQQMVPVQAPLPRAERRAIERAERKERTALAAALVREADSLGDEEEIND